MVLCYNDLSPNSDFVSFISKWLLLFLQGIQCWISGLKVELSELSQQRA